MIYNFLCCIFDDINISKVVPRDTMYDDRMWIWPQFDQVLVVKCWSHKQKPQENIYIVRALVL